MNVTGYKKHIAKKGETPDMLAFKYYSDEYMTSYILEVNVRYQNVMEYEGGEELLIPIFDTLDNDETLAPWRRS